jgi:hypothetical protein
VLAIVYICPGQYIPGIKYHNLEMPVNPISPLFLPTEKEFSGVGDYLHMMRVAGPAYSLLLGHAMYREGWKAIGKLLYPASIGKVFGDQCRTQGGDDAGILRYQHF